MTAALALVDSHAHLQAGVFAGDLDPTLRRAREAGLWAVVVVGTDLESSAAAIAMAEGRDWLHAAVGVHPHDADGVGPGELATLRTLAAHRRVVAVGETGLDYYRMLSPRGAQLAVFRAQLDLAAEMGLPLVVHSRAAADDTWATVSEWAGRLPPGYRGGRGAGVMHCFEGDLQLAERYVGIGFAISIAGPVTYPNAKQRQDVARGLPLEALVVETDSPYLAPQGRRGERNEPAYLAETVRFVAGLRGESPERVASATAENAGRLFALPVAAASRRASGDPP